jgi:hypothetical protein
MGGVDVPDDDKISDIETVRSLKIKNKENKCRCYLILIYCWLLTSIR